MRVKLEQNIWDGRNPVEIDLPDEWDIKIPDLPVDSAPVISREEIYDKLEHPVGMPPLSELAVGKKKVGIAFDDSSRGTPADLIAGVVLDILLAAGVKKENIFFICATGSHGTHNRKQFADKLGEEIVSQYVVLNHNCYENCTSVGVSKEGVDVKINNEFLDCDLKLGIGVLLPHSMCGFTGGYRLLVPGLCHMDTIEGIHNIVNAYCETTDHPELLSGHKENMFMHEMIAEMGRMAGPFFKIDCVINSRLEPVALFAGEALEEYCEAAPVAEKMYLMKKPRSADLVIANVNAKTSYASMGFGFAMGFLAQEGGDIVLVNFTKDGQSPHFLRGYWGEKCEPRIPVGDAGMPLPPKGKVIYYSASFVFQWGNH